MVKQSFDELMKAQQIGMERLRPRWIEYRKETDKIISEHVEKLFSLIPVEVKQ